jgi:hypothetical protein
LNKKAPAATATRVTIKENGVSSIWRVNGPTEKSMRPDATAITSNPNENDLTGIFAEAIVEEVHVHHQAVPIGADQPAFALNAFAQVLKMGTLLAGYVSGNKGYSATIFCHMHVDMVVGLKLAINHQG